MAEAEKKDELGLESSAFEALERDFQEVLTELVGDKSLERFRVEYEKLHRALKKSHESEKRLIKKCRELNSEIVSNAAKVQAALKHSQEDREAVAALRKEMDKAWKMVEASHEKENRAKETIQQLKLEISNLSRLVEQGAGLTLGQENTVNELMKAKEELLQERDGHVAAIVQLRNEAADLQDKLTESETQRTQQGDEITSLREVIAAKKAEVERETRRKERLEKELESVRALVENRTNEIKQKQVLIQQLGIEIATQTLTIKNEREQRETIQKDRDGLKMRVQSLQHDLDEQENANAQLLKENKETHLDLRQREDEINSNRQQMAKDAKMREKQLRRIRELEDKSGEATREIERLLGDIKTLTTKQDLDKKALEAKQNKITELEQQNNMLGNNIRKSQLATQKQADLVKINENTRKNLELEIRGYKEEAQAQRKEIYKLEKEREKYGAEASEATSKYLQAMEEVKIRENTIADLKKTIAEGEAKLKQQQNLYEAVRSDRNLYSKNLIEAQDEIAEMKRKFKIMNHQIEQLKEEITAKDQALVKEHFDHKKVEKEKDILKNEGNALKDKLNEADQTRITQTAEITKLNSIINEGDAELQRQKKEYDSVVNERNILGTQLIRRNDELALLYEKIKIQRTTLRKGEMQYRERTEDIRMLKIKINDLRRELHITKSHISSIEVLRNEVYHLQRELLQERTKVKALSEELENPMNVHRWRKLEGSDPGTYEMVQKIQTLQKRLISKTEEVVEKDLLIQEKEKLYIELKNILARQPGPEVAEQLSVYQQNLREKTRQMKAMASELNMYQAQVNEYKYEIERLTRELQDVKRRYYEQKRREQLLNAPEQPKGYAVQQRANGPRFTGGGFSLGA